MSFDPRKKFVRVKELRKDGFVDFDFAVGEPELFVEMMLPASAFDEFCHHNSVHFLEQRPDPQPTVVADAWEWSLREARHRRLDANPTARPSPPRVPFKPK